MGKHQLVTAIELCITNLDTGLQGVIERRKVIMLDAASRTELAPLAHQRPAFNKILLDIELVITRSLVLFRLCLHVDTHSAY